MQDLEMKYTVRTDMKRHISRASIVTVSLWLVLVLFLSTTHPHKMPVYMLMVPFILLGLALYSTFTSLETGFKRSSAASSPKHRALWMLLAVACVLLVALQSIGEFKLLDSLVVFGFMTVLYFYISRMSTKKEPS